MPVGSRSLHRESRYTGHALVLISFDPTVRCDEFLSSGVGILEPFGVSLRVYYKGVYIILP